MVGDAGAGQLGADLVFEAGHGLVVTLAAADDEAELDAEAEVGGLRALGCLVPFLVGDSPVARWGFVVTPAEVFRLRGDEGEVRHGGR